MSPGGRFGTVSSTGNLPAQGTTSTDRDLASKVRTAFNNDQSLSSDVNNVIIITHDGVLTLGGTVSNASAHQRVLAEAKKQAGGAKIDDRISVGTASSGTNDVGTP